LAVLPPEEEEAEEEGTRYKAEEEVKTR